MTVVSAIVRNAIVLVECTALLVFSGCQEESSVQDPNGTSTGGGDSESDTGGSGGTSTGGSGGTSSSEDEEEPLSPPIPEAACESLRDGFVPEIAVTRTEGKAPLSLYVDATVASHPQLTDRSDKFHRMFVSYDFGDDIGETWPASGTPKSFSCCAPTTGHVYEEPGVYSLTANFYDGDGSLGSCTTVITVNEWSEEDTVCVSDNDDFSQCPEDAERLTSASFSEVIANAEDDTRILFRRGGLFSGGARLEATGTMLGAFGNEELPAPRIETQDEELLRVTGSNLRIVGLNLVLLGENHEERNFNCRDEIDHVLLYKSRLEGGFRTFNCGPVATINEMHAVENEIVLIPIAGEAYGSMFQPWNGSLWLGNRITGDVGSTEEKTHDLVRMQEARESVISYNDHSLAPSGAGIANFRLHSDKEEGNSFDDPRTTKWIVMSWNQDVLVNATSASPGDHAEENMFEILAEFNTYDGVIWFNSQNTTLRWNLVGGITVGDADASDPDNPLNNAAGPFWVYGNSCFSTTRDTGLLNEDISGPASAGGVFAWGNAAYLPDAEQPTFFEGPIEFDEGNIAVNNALPFSESPDFNDAASFDPRPNGPLIGAAPQSTLEHPNPFAWGQSRLEALDAPDAGARQLEAEDITEAN